MGLAEEDWRWDLNPGMAAMMVFWSEGPCGFGERGDCAALAE